jgi:hypothetical protein
VSHPSITVKVGVNEDMAAIKLEGFGVQLVGRMFAAILMEAGNEKKIRTACFACRAHCWRNSGTWVQGDQIGRISAYWVTIFFGQLLLRLQKEAKYLGFFFQRKKICIILTKKWVWMHFRRVFHKLDCLP